MRKTKKVQGFAVYITAALDELSTAPTKQTDVRFYETLSCVAASLSVNVECARLNKQTPALVDVQLLSGLASHFLLLAIRGRISAYIGIIAAEAYLEQALSILTD